MLDDDSSLLWRAQYKEQVLAAALELTAYGLAPSLS
jgi:hypothetical protein